MGKAASGMVPNISLREQLLDVQRENLLHRSGLTNAVHLQAIAWGCMLRDHRTAVELTMEIEGLDKTDACDAVFDSLEQEERDRYMEEAAILHEGMQAYHAA